MSQEDFDIFYKAIWQSGPRTSYSNPDAWSNNYAVTRMV